MDIKVTLKLELPEELQDVHDWRYDGRAYCHQDGGYYLNVMKKVSVVKVDKGFLNPMNNCNDRNEKYWLWGEILKIEYKLVNPKTGTEVAVPGRDNYLVMPQTQIERYH